MEKDLCAASVYSIFVHQRIPALGLALAVIIGASPQLATAQTAKSDDPGQSVEWAPPAIAHAQRMRAFRDVGIGSELGPIVIPRYEVDLDPSGAIGTFQPGGPTFPQFNAFFQNLGTNGRTCFSCHQPQNGWTVSAAGVQARFNASAGTEPIFRLVDGATCPTNDVSTLAARSKAFSLLTGKGLIRIGLPLPTTNLQFAVTNVVVPTIARRTRLPG
jgi:hypothetical protein